MGATGIIAQMALDERREHPMRVSVASGVGRYRVAFTSHGVRYVGELTPGEATLFPDRSTRAVVPVASFFPGEVQA